MSQIGVFTHALPWGVVADLGTALAALCLELAGRIVRLLGGAKLMLVVTCEGTVTGFGQPAPGRMPSVTRPSKCRKTSLQPAPAGTAVIAYDRCRRILTRPDQTWLRGDWPGCKNYAHGPPHHSGVLRVPQAP